MQGELFFFLLFLIYLPIYHTRPRFSHAICLLPNGSIDLAFSRLIANASRLCHDFLRDGSIDLEIARLVADASRLCHRFPP